MPVGVPENTPAGVFVPLWILLGLELGLEPVGRGREFIFSIMAIFFRNAVSRLRIMDTTIRVSYASCHIGYIISHRI
jgi:hypothetical protein